MLQFQWKVWRVDGPDNDWSRCEYRRCTKRAVLLWRRFFTTRLLCQRHSDEITGGPR